MYDANIIIIIYDIYSIYSKFILKNLDNGLKNELLI